MPQAEPDVPRERLVQGYRQGFGHNVVRLQDPGANGVNNAVGISNIAAAAEGFNLGVQLGADPKALLDVLSKSSAQSFVLDYMSAFLLSGDFIANDAPVLRLLLEDLGLAHQMAHEAGVSMPTSGVALDLFERFRSAWPDIEDVAGVVLALEQDNRTGEMRK